jgi:large subunit ribosomal protein L37Ae
MPRKIGLAGGFGARYGTVARRQYVEIVAGLRSKHECPRCRFKTVKRWSVGVWHCRKCGHKFAGGAYTPTTKLGEIAARATRGLMSPSTLSTELDSLRAGAKVAAPMVVPTRKPRTRRKKPADVADVIEEVRQETAGEAEAETAVEDQSQ